MRDQCVLGGRPRIDERAQGSRALNVAGDDIYWQSEMLCKKPIADASNSFPHA